MTYPPAAMRRPTASRYCDLSEAEFNREVAAGRLPAPFKVGRHEHWSTVQLDKALLLLAGEDLGDFKVYIGGEAA